MVWKKMIILVIVLAMAVLALAWLRVYYVQDGAVGNLIWNSTEAYVFVNAFQYGYTFSYLGYLGEMVRESFPFGASPPDKKHFYVIVLHITPEAIDRYSVDNFHIGSPPFVVGQNIYAGNLLAETGPMKWSGTHFEPMSPEEQEGVQDAQNSGKIPNPPSYDNIGGWSRRMVDVVSPEKDAAITIELEGRQLTLLAHSGFIDHEAFIDLSRPGRAPERIWHLSEKSARVSRATYKQIFGND